MEGIYITQSRLNWSQPQKEQQYTGFVIHMVNARLVCSEFTNCTRANIVRYAEDRFIENPSHYYVQHPEDALRRDPVCCGFSLRKFE